MCHRIRLGMIAALPIAGCHPPSARQPVDVRAEVQVVDDQFATAFAAHDAAALAALFTDDAKLLPPDDEPVVGRAAIRTFWEGAIAAGVARATLTAEEASGTDSLAIEVGHYSLSDSSGALMEEGKYVVWWKRTGADWRLYRDIWNGNKPAR